MKQHIEISDLNELSPKAKEKLREWWKPEEYDLVTDGDWNIIRWASNEELGFYVDSKSKTYKDQHSWDSTTDEPIIDTYYAYPLLSIGQCIEFLYEQQDLETFQEFKDNFKPSHYCLFPNFSVNWNKDMELIDALFLEVKYILEENEVYNEGNKNWKAIIRPTDKDMGNGPTYSN